MQVTVSVAGEEDRQVDVDPARDGEEATTYGDLVETVGLSPQEATALVDGRPVPDDAPVDAERVAVLRLIRGG